MSTRGCAEGVSGSGGKVITCVEGMLEASDGLGEKERNETKRNETKRNETKRRISFN